VIGELGWAHDAGDDAYGAEWWGHQRQLGCDDTSAGRSLRDTQASSF
jgi:hypothetical protein